MGRVKKVAAALQELKATRAHVDKEEDHACDISFSGQTETVCHACGDLSQQVKINLLWQSDMEKLVPEESELKLFTKILKMPFQRNYTHSFLIFKPLKSRTNPHNCQ